MGSTLSKKVGLPLKFLTILSHGTLVGLTNSQFLCILCGLSSATSLAELLAGLKASAEVNIS